MLKLSDNPPMLHPEVNSLRGLDGTWFVAHTKARFEKAFAWDLHSRGINYFLPMFERIKISGGKKRRVMMPLFSSYVFFCGTRAQRHDALLTDRLCQVIEVRDQMRLIDELTDLHLAVTGGARFDPYPFAVVGRRCRVTHGPLQGIIGTIIHRDGDTNPRLVLQVSLLSQGASMEIDADLLEPMS